MGILLLIAALFWAFTLWRASRNESLAESIYPPQGQILSVNGADVHAVVMGEGPDVVLIHGSGGNTRDMTFALAPALAESYRVIVIDRPGLGFSAPLEASGDSISDQAEQLMLAARQLGADRPIVVGQSYGGSVALAWAVNHPDAVSALVPVAAASNPWTTPLDPLYRITSTRTGAALVTPLISAFVPESYVSAAIAEIFAPQTVPVGYTAYVGSGLTLRRSSMRATGRQRAALLGEITALYPHYGEIVVPTEILHGTADDTVNISLHSEALERQIPGAVLTPLDGIGHMPQHSAVPDVVAAIDRAAARAGLR
ncbi:MAG: alpha/beta hydrolase [Pseudomonadota bacterium]